MRSIFIFLAIAFGLSWLIALPLWFGDGLTSPFFGLVALAMMATPAIAALIVVFVVDKPTRKAAALGLWPVGRPGRFIGYLALALVVPVVLILAALPIGALFGVYPADFVNFSGFQEITEAQLAATGAPALPIPIGVLVALQFVNVLIGYNYPTAPGWLGLVMMCGMCVVVGAVFSWLRIRSGSVWAPALAHGAFNAAAGFSIVFVAAGSVIDTTQATILGWSGWLVPIVLVTVLAVTGQFRPAPTPEAQPELATSR